MLKVLTLLKLNFLNRFISLIFSSDKVVLRKITILVNVVEPLADIADHG